MPRRSKCTGKLTQPVTVLYQWKHSVYKPFPKYQPVLHDGMIY